MLKLYFGKFTFFKNIQPDNKDEKIVQHVSKH